MPTAYLSVISIMRSEKLEVNSTTSLASKRTVHPCKLLQSSERLCNGAQALLSSGAMYGGFMTLQKRREIAELAREHVERVNLVRSLQDTVREKEELMSVRLCHLNVFYSPTRPSSWSHPDYLKLCPIMDTAIPLMWPSASWQHLRFHSVLATLMMQLCNFLQTDRKEVSRLGAASAAFPKSSKSSSQAHAACMPPFGFAAEPESCGVRLCQKFDPSDCKD